MIPISAGIAGGKLKLVVASRISPSAVAKPSYKQATTQRRTNTSAKESHLDLASTPARAVLRSTRMNDPNPSATGSQYPSPAAMQQQQQQQYASSGQQQQQQPQPQPPQEQYRGSPPGSHMSQPPPPLLPPIQHLEGQGPPPMQQQPQHYPQPPINGAQMQYGHAPSPPNLYPYPPDGAIAPNGVPNGHTAMRYPLPPQSMDARNMSGGRHKKEIKRRTKTGCLTCRKRRIKVRECGECRVAGGAERLR